MKNSLVLCVVIWTVVFHTCNAENESNQENTTDARQPRYSVGHEEPIFLIRPVTKDGSGQRHPINRKSNPIPMAPMMGNGFLIRTKTAGGDDDERVVKEFISHFGQVVTRIDHGNSRKVEPPKYISLPPNVNYFIKTIQNPQPVKKYSTQSNLMYRHPRPNVVHQRPAGFLKKRNIKSEPLYQMTPQFRASPPFAESVRPVKTTFSDIIPSMSDDWTPTSSIASSPTLMHAIENKQYQNQQFIKSKKEKMAYTQHLMEDFHLPNFKPSKSSFTSMTIAVADDKLPSFKPKVSLRVAATDEKIKMRTRLKPVREIQEESDKPQNVQDQYGEENVEKKFESDTPSPLFVTPVEVTTTKTTKFYKHRSSLKLNDSCESTCLMNIVNLDYDPLCGSNDHTYMNVAKFRCAKICGQLQLTIKHFGSCEDNQAMKAEI